MRPLRLTLLALPLAAFAADQAVVLEANWTRFSQSTDLRYTYLGTQTRVEPAAARPADPYLLIDTAQDQRITVYRHNSSWRCDPLEPKPRHDSARPGRPDRPALPQPPPGIGPQGPIGPRTGAGSNVGLLNPPIGYSAPAAAPLTGQPAGLGPRGQIGPRTVPGTTSGAVPPPPLPQSPAMPPLPDQTGSQSPRIGYPIGSAPASDLPELPPAVVPQAGVGPGAGRPGVGVGDGMPVGMGANLGGGMTMPSMPGREQSLALVKTDETQPLLGRTAVKYTLSGRMMETVEVWAVPDADFGPFFAYRPQPPHRFGPVDLQDEWDSLLRREHLFPLLAIFKQGDREVARFTVTTIATRECPETADHFTPPAEFYRCPPDPF